MRMLWRDRGAPRDGGGRGRASLEPEGRQLHRQGYPRAVGPLEAGGGSSRAFVGRIVVGGSRRPPSGRRAEGREAAGPGMAQRAVPRGPRGPGGRGPGGGEGGGPGGPRGGGGPMGGASCPPLGDSPRAPPRGRPPAAQKSINPWSPPPRGGSPPRPTPPATAKAWLLSWRASG